MVIGVDYSNLTIFMGRPQLPNCIFFGRIQLS